MNNPSDKEQEQEQEPDPGLAVVDTEIIEMLVENEPGKYISVDIVPIKTPGAINVIDYTMHKNWVNVYEDDVVGAPLFQFDDGANVADLIGKLIGIISDKVNTVDDMPAIRFIVSYAKSIFYINAITLMKVDAFQLPIPGGDPKDGGVLVTIDINANKAAQEEAARVASAEEANKAAEEEAARVASAEAANKAAEEEEERVRLAETETAAQRLAEEKEAELAKLTTPPTPPQETYADVLAHQETVDLPTPPQTNNKNVSLTAEQQSDREQKRAEADKITAEYEKEKQRLRTEKEIAEAATNKEIDDALAISAAEQARLAEAEGAKQARLDMEADEKQRQLAMEAENKRLLEQQRLEFNKARQQEKKNQKDAIRRQKEKEIEDTNKFLDAEAATVAAAKAAEESARQQEAAKISAAIAAEAEKKKLEQNNALQLRKADIQRKIDAYRAREAADKLAAEKAAAEKVAAEKAAAEKAAAQKIAEEKAAADKLAAEKAAADKLAAEKAAAEKAAAQKIAEEKAAAEKAAAQKIAEEKAAADKLAADKLAAEKAAAEKAAAQKIAEEKAAAEKAAAQKIAEEKAAAEKLAAEKLAAEKAAAEKAAAEKAAAEKLAAEKLAAEKLAAEKLAAEKAAAEKLAAEKAAAEKLAAEKLAAEKAAAQKIAEAKANRMMSAVLAKRKQQLALDTESWRDSNSDEEEITKTGEQNDEVDSESEPVDTGAKSNESIAAVEESVENLATQAQITENLTIIRSELFEHIINNRTSYNELKPHIDKINKSYNWLNTINSQNSDIAPTLDNVLTELNGLNNLFVLDDTRKSHPTPTYKFPEKNKINVQSTKIVAEIDNILRRIRNDETNVYPEHVTRTPQIDVRAESTKMKEALGIKTNEIINPTTIDNWEKQADILGEAVLPAKEVAKSSEPALPSIPAANLPPPQAKQRLPLFPARSQSAANPPLPPAKEVALVKSPVNAAKPVTPRFKPATSNVFDRLSQEKTVASRNWENEEQKHREEIEKKHWEDMKARPPVKKRGGQSTKKKSRKLSHNKRHTKRATSIKQQPKTRNKRTKRGRNQTHKK